MTTFQAVVLSIVNGFSTFLPVSENAHNWLIPYLLGWPMPTGALAAALSLGTLLALLIYFRHDWASIFSSFLRVVLLFKKPMTLDERLPFFIIITSLPVTGFYYYFEDVIGGLEVSPLWVAGSLLIFSFPLWLGNRLNRRTKNMFNWNWVDALVVGFTQILLLIPGAGRQVGALAGALLRNYNKEAAAKYTFFSLLPILVARTISHFQSFEFGSAEPQAGLSWLSFYVAIVVTTLAGVFFIAGFMKTIQHKGFGGYLGYRTALAICVIAVFAYRNYF